MRLGFRSDLLRLRGNRSLTLSVANVAIILSRERNLGLSSTPNIASHMNDSLQMHMVPAAPKRLPSRGKLLAVGGAAALALYVIGWQIEWRILKPLEYQQLLFGRTIAGPLSMRGSSLDCCSFDGGGILEWTYSLPPNLSEVLAARCRLPDGTPRPFTDVRTPHYDKLTQRCVVARRYDEAKAEDVAAVVRGERLYVRVSWW